MRSRHSARRARSSRGSAAPRPRERARRGAGRAIAAHGVQSVFDTATGYSPRPWAAPEVALEGVAKGGDWQCTASAVRARLVDGAQHLAGPRAGPGGRERGKVPEHLLAARRPASSLAGAVLDDERAKTRRTAPYPEARQIVVPHNVAMVSGAGVGDGAGREVGLVPRHPASTVWHGGSFADLSHRVKG